MKSTFFRCFVKMLVKNVKLREADQMFHDEFASTTTINYHRWLKKTTKKKLFNTFAEKSAISDQWAQLNSFLIANIVEESTQSEKVVELEHVWVSFWVVTHGLELRREDLRPSEHEMSFDRGRSLTEFKNEDKADQARVSIIIHCWRV